MRYSTLARAGFVLLLLATIGGLSVLTAPQAQAQAEMPDCCGGSSTQLCKTIDHCTGAPGSSLCSTTYVYYQDAQ